MQPNNISAIDAVSPHPNVSGRYKFVSTRDALNALEAQGFQYKSVKTRVAYGMHTVTLEHPDLKTVLIGKSLVTPRVVLRNSHDTSAAFGLIAGAYRAACFNDLILGFAVRMIHTGSIQSDIRDAMPNIFNTIQRGINQMQDWSQVQLTSSQAHAFARTCLDLRFNDTQLLGLDIDYYANTLLRAIRDADTSPDLFTIYNRIQERLVRGGWTAYIDAKAFNVRKLYGMRSVLSVNQALSNRAEKLYNQLTKGA